MSGLFERLQELVRAEEPVVLATVVNAARSVGAKLLVHDDGTTEGDLGFPALRDRVVADALEYLAVGQSHARSYTDPEVGEVEVFFDVYPAPPTLLIFGAVHVGVALCHLAKDLGFRVKVIDARGSFATRERFPDADEIVISHADDFLAREKVGSSTYVAVLSHDPKLDDPALLRALPSNARYVGAIGSRKTNAARLERLRQAGLTEAQLRRLHGGPVGLDIGAQNPEEIALSILAQMIAAKNGVPTLPAAADGVGAPELAGRRVSI